MATHPTNEYRAIEVDSMDEYERLTIINNDGLLGAARGILWFFGFVDLITGCISGYQFGSGGTMPSAPEWVAVGAGIVIFLTSAFFALVNFIVANSLANGSKWAWYAGIVLGSLYLLIALPTCCGAVLPGLIVAGLVRKPVRQAYGI